MSGMVDTGVLEALNDARLLTPEQYAELTEQMYPLCPDWSILGAELIYRGWLTPFQMEEVLAGRAEGLFLGSFVLEEPLAEGGMGSVFRARNWKLGKTVALKVIRKDLAQNDAIVRRFRREILALGKVTHPNIVHAFDAEWSGTTLYYAMEFVPGIDLGRLVRRQGPLDVARACFYVAQTAQALQYAHELGLIHRDIKPSNLLLEPEAQTIKLLDLGLARFDLADDDRSQLTRVGSLVGTPDFVAPEQIHDSHDVDIRSDLYSLGGTFYFLLTGRAPFEDEEAVDKLYCHVREEPVPVAHLRPGLPAEVAAIVHRLLAKDPAKRFAEPIELLEALLPFVRSVDPGAAPTLVDGKVPTDVALPPLPEGSALAPTQVVAPAELDLLNVIPKPEDEAAPNAPAHERKTLTRLAQTGLAMLLALAALLVMWRSGHGPGNADVPGAVRVPDGKAAPAPPADAKTNGAEAVGLDQGSPPHLSLSGPDVPPPVEGDGPHSR